MIPGFDLECLVDPESTAPALLFRDESLGDGGMIRLIADRISIGRDEESTIALSDPSVSEHHAVLNWEDNGFFLSDLSSNGTMVNMQRISEPTRLKNEDFICFGCVEAYYSHPPTVLTTT